MENHHKKKKYKYKYKYKFFLKKGQGLTTKKYLEVPEVRANEVGEPSNLNSHNFLHTSLPLQEVTFFSFYMIFLFNNYK